MKDAREKFDTVADCEPAVETLFWGAHESCREVARHAERQGRGAVLPMTMKRLIDGTNAADGRRRQPNTNNAPLSEQDLYAGADAMEIVRDAHAYFSKRMDWKSTKDTLSDLERVHHVGVDAMGLLVTGHLTGAGAAVRRKVDGGGGASAAADGKKKKNASIVRLSAVERAEETAATTQDRLQEALQNRDLMKSIVNMKSIYRYPRGWFGNYAPFLNVWEECHPMAKV